MDETLYSRLLNSRNIQEIEESLTWLSDERLQEILEYASEERDHQIVVCAEKEIRRRL